MDTKKCPRCGEEKPIEKFPTYNRWYCQECLVKWNRDWRQRKRKEFLAANPPTPRTHKKCLMCGDSKPIAEFNFCNKSKGWLASYCKTCSLARSYADRKKRGREDEVLFYRCRRMGTTAEWYNAKLEEQGHVCAICGNGETHPIKRGSFDNKVRNLAIDHDHGSTRVRGLLCTKCNQSLYPLEKHGLWWAERAVEYLKRYSESK